MLYRQSGSVNSITGNEIAIGISVAEDSLRRRLQRLFVREGWRAGPIGDEGAVGAFNVIVVDPQRAARLHRPVPALLLVCDAEELPAARLAADARALVDQDDLDTAFLTAVHEIAAGHGWISPTLVRSLLRRTARDAMPDRAPVENAAARAGVPVADLTTRESEVMALAAQGLNNSEIAENLCVAESTVKFHMSNVLRKTGFRDRHQLTARLPMPTAALE